MFIDQVLRWPNPLRSEERSACWVILLSLISAPPNGVDDDFVLQSINMSLLRSENRSDL